ncbi:hypothetical protein KFL_006320020 [Klebsormidium nitens]|uniref:DUF218 domain-containing protein n=1 Tax=Klebsormidium nitens TaxID=105231 RepID=A0A1Y1II33_KLENI|nr:hypothetical protein KFL_006320020 [Klebsormidium nitens]|eukprot:GAQ90363.1 hypothetical protein KFL_006320020 [Klebsormidium nitens]
MWLFVPALAVAVAGLRAWWRWNTTSMEAQSARDWDTPQAFLLLGGDREREALAACMFGKLLEQTPLCWPVYVSSAHEDILDVMTRWGVVPPQLIIDDRALDTVTNFTSLLGDFRRRKISHLWLVTSDYHMPRAHAVARILLAGHGVAHSCLSLPCSANADSKLVKSETRARIARDQLRAYLWLSTGFHGADFLRFTKPSRYRHHILRQSRGSLAR